MTEPDTNWKYRDPSRTYYIARSRCLVCLNEWHVIRECVDNDDARRHAVARCAACGSRLYVEPWTVRRYRGEPIA